MRTLKVPSVEPHSSAKPCACDSLALLGWIEPKLGHEAGTSASFPDACQSPGCHLHTVVVGLKDQGWWVVQSSLKKNKKLSKHFLTYPAFLVQVEKHSTVDPRKEERGRGSCFRNYYPSHFLSGAVLVPLVQRRFC